MKLWKLYKLIFRCEDNKLIKVLTIVFQDPLNSQIDQWEIMDIVRAPLALVTCGYWILRKTIVEP